MKYDPFRTSHLSEGVAPYAGAWIEMNRGAKEKMSSQSLPTRERGLKYFVPPFVFDFCWSLPTRERGLKSAELHHDIGSEESLPTRERGLKSQATDDVPVWNASLPTRERGLK